MTRKTLHILILVVFALNVLGMSLANADGSCGMECCAKAPDSIGVTSYEQPGCCTTVGSTTCSLEGTLPGEFVDPVLCSTQCSANPGIAKADLGITELTTGNNLKSSDGFSETGGSTYAVPIYISNLSFLC